MDISERLPYNIKNIVEEGTTYDLTKAVNMINTIDGITEIRDADTHRENFMVGGNSKSCELIILFILILLVIVNIEYASPNITKKRSISPWLWDNKKGS